MRTLWGAGRRCGVRELLRVGWRSPVWQPGRRRQMTMGGVISKGHLSGSYRVTVFAPGSDTEVLDTVTGMVRGRRINA